MGAQLPYNVCRQVWVFLAARTNIQQTPMYFDRAVSYFGASPHRAILAGSAREAVRARTLKYAEAIATLQYQMKQARGGCTTLNESLGKSM